MDGYKVYARVDKAGRVVEINSSAFVDVLPGAANWCCIDQGVGDRYHHAQGNYLPTPLMDARGILAYKLVDGKAVQRTQAEMDADAAAQSAQEPSDVDTLMELVLDQEERLCMLEMGMGNE